MFAQVRQLNVYSNHGPSQTSQLVFEWFKILTQQTPAATRVQPAYRMAEMLLNRLSPDFLIPPKIRQDSALQAARNLYFLLLA